ncbi:MAG: 3-phosphoserine/phosphohydroxythreonine transaminase [Chitinophagales bacterium]
MKKYNFSAGPSILDPQVVRETIENIDNSNKLSLIELSHRGPEIQKLFADTKALVKEMLHLDDRFEVLFLHGGASLQNCMIPYNIRTKGIAAYTDTGIWAHKAIEESSIIRETKVVASSKDANYSFLPSIGDWDEEGYLHLTSNNTVHGTQYHSFPKLRKASLLVDMSSDILSRKVDYNQFSLIYAGLQKNLGTAGGCLVIVDKNILEEEYRLPKMLDYKEHIKAESMVNTPPVFAVLMCNIVLRWIAANGGVEEMEKRSIQKARLLYDEIDRNPLIEGFVREEDRSLINASFKTSSPSLETELLNYLKTKGIEGIDGHRSKGGFRASMYNMMPVSHVEYLVDCLQKFSK